MPCNARVLDVSYHVVINAYAIIRQFKGVTMYSYDDLFLFIRVAEVGNFSYTSKLLQIGQSTISTRIKRLEADLGVDLIARNNKSFELTDAGQELFNSIKNSEADIRNHVTRSLNAKQIPSGVLRVILPHGFSQEYIVPKLNEFLIKYPEIKLQVYFDNKETDLVRHGIDYAILSYIPANQSLKIKFLFESEFIMFCTPEYKEKYGVPESIEDLENHHIYTSSFDYSVVQQVNAVNVNTGESIVLKLPDRVSFNNSVIAQKMVYSNEIIGGGFKFLVAKELHHNALIHVLPDYVFLSLRFYQVRHPQGGHLKVEVFAKFIEECVANYHNDIKLLK